MGYNRGGCKKQCLDKAVIRVTTLSRAMDKSCEVQGLVGRIMLKLSAMP